MDIPLPDRKVRCYVRQGLIYKIWQLPILAKWDFFFFKKKKVGAKNLTAPYSVPFLSVLHQNKALYNFHKRGQSPTVGHIKARWGIPTWLVLRLEQHRA